MADRVRIKFFEFVETGTGLSERAELSETAEFLGQGAAGPFQESLLDPAGEGKNFGGGRSAEVDDEIRVLLRNLKMSEAASLEPQRFDDFTRRPV